MAADEANCILDLTKQNKRKRAPVSNQQDTSLSINNELPTKPSKHTKATMSDDSEDDNPCETIKLIKIPIFNKLPNTRGSNLKRDKSKSQKDIKKVRAKKKLAIDRKRRNGFPCRKCDAKFESASELKSHSVEHQDQTRHKCEECGRCFTRAMSLKIHMHSHSKDHKCSVCVNTFPSIMELRQHMRLHKRTVECEQCDGKFHTEEQLARHMRKHSNEAQSVKYGSDDQSSNSSQNRLVMDLNEDGTCVSGGMGNSVESKDSNKIDVITQREELSHSTQVAIINKMYKGRSIDDICKIYNITQTLVNEVWEDRDKFDRPKKMGVKTAKYMNSILDTKILEWYNEQRENNVTVTGKMIQDIAESVATEYEFVTFNGNKKWLERFKKKHNILLKGPHLHRDYSTSEFKFKNQFFNETWYDARLGVPDEYIYTADEVGLFFNASKGRTKKITGKKFIQGHVKDRLSIFMCTNATGTDKKKLLVCGSEDPLIHSYRDASTLPVDYVRHSEAQFTTEVFEEYVRNWNSQLYKSNQKAILVLDRATIHSKLQMSNLKLVFVPWKTSGLVPIKNGIFERFRSEFRKLLLLEVACNVTRGLYRDMTCLEALEMFEKAWERVPPDVITTSFQDTGYDIYKTDQQMQLEMFKQADSLINCNKVENDEVIARKLKLYNVEEYFTDVTLLDMYLTVDEELLTAQGTNVSVFGGNHKGKRKIEPLVVKKSSSDILPIGTEKPESSGTEMFVRKARALEDLEIVRKYLQTHDTSFHMYNNFMAVENFLYTQSMNNTQS